MGFPQIQTHDAAEFYVTVSELPCPQCEGDKSFICRSCRGTGGAGYICESCRGTGTENCDKCDGSALVQTVSRVRFATIERFPAYRFGDDGSVWSRAGVGGARIKRGFSRTWRKLKPIFQKRHGYMHVTLVDSSGKRIQAGLHRLILEAFYGPPPFPGAETRHYPNRDPTDNRLCNLQWGTKQENAADKVDHGTEIIGSKRSCAKLTEADIPVIRQLLGQKVTQAVIAKRFGVSTTVISKINLGKEWRHVP